MRETMAAMKAKEALQRCPLFSSFNEEELEALSQGSRRVNAAAAEVLFREGEPGDFLFAIVSGTVRIVSQTGPNREQTLAFCGPGECFGEMSLLDGAPRSATAIVCRPSTLIRIDRGNMESLRRRYPEAQTKFLANALQLTSTRLRSANTRLVELARLGSQARAQIEEIRSQILSLVSHELRTPLTVIKSSAQVLKRSGTHTERNNPFLEKIERQSERLRLLVDDLIALALLRARPGVQHASEFDAMKLTEEVLSKLKAAATKKGLRLSMVRRHESAPVLGDRALLGRALHHLVSNALKFSPPASEVKVEAERLAGDGVKLSVVDRGAGISLEARERIFQPFTQEQAPLNREVDGLGIGLTLAREVMIAHGGQLAVDSEPGQGSRFTMVLPPERGGRVSEGALHKGREKPK